MMKKAKKHDPEFMKLLAEHVAMDEAGNLEFSGVYASIHVNFPFKGSLVSVPKSHVVWFLTHGRWPAEGYQLDHIDDNPANDAIENLQELTPEENQRKRRGRIVFRSYGKGRYGHGMGIYHDKRDGRFYVTHTLPRAAHKTLKTIKKCLGGFASRSAAETKIAQHIASLAGPA